MRLCWLQASLKEFPSACTLESGILLPGCYRPSLMRLAPDIFLDFAGWTVSITGASEGWIEDLSFTRIA